MERLLALMRKHRMVWITRRGKTQLPNDPYPCYHLAHEEALYNVRRFRTIKEAVDWITTDYEP